MSNNQDGQGFDDWFAAHFNDQPPTPASPPKPPVEPSPPAVPPHPPAVPPHPPSAPAPGVPPHGAPQPPGTPGVPPLVMQQQPVQPPQYNQFPTQQQPMQPPAEHWQQQAPTGHHTSMPPSAMPLGAMPPGAMPPDSTPLWAGQPGPTTHGQPVPPPTFTQPQQPMQQPMQPPTQPSFDPFLAGQDAVATEFIPSATQAAGGGLGEANPLDALFGDDRFRDYEQDPPPAAAPGPGTGDDGNEPPKGISRTHVTLMWVAGSAVAILALFAFFLFGTRLPTLTGTGTTPTSEPAPVETERPEGPVAPGTYNWNELLGGECLEDFRGAWENEYTVIDCAQPHAAQLIIRAAVPVVTGTGGAYPGVSDLQSRMNLLCTDAAVVDYHAANVYDDVQFEASFPPSVEEWDAGRRDYFCYVSRASGEPIEGSLAAPPATEQPAEEDTGDSTEND